MTIKSLENRTIITTMSVEKSSDIIASLQAQGASGLSLPMIETETISLPNAEMQQITSLLKDCDYLVFTSSKGIDGWFENFNADHNSHLEYLKSIKIATVGDATSRALKKHGLDVSIENPGTTGEDLASHLKEIVKPEEKIILALGEKAPDTLRAVLDPLSSLVHRINVYKTVYIEKFDPTISQILRSGQADMCIFASPSAFENFLRHFDPTKAKALAAIGKTTARFIREKGYTVQVMAEQPNTMSLISNIKTFFQSQNTSNSINLR